MEARDCPDASDDSRDRVFNLLFVESLCVDKRVQWRCAIYNNACRCSDMVHNQRASQRSGQLDWAKTARKTPHHHLPIF